MTTKDILSVGIDVGTTTSQLVLSQLTVTNQARAGLVPRLDIDARTVLYESEPRFTPLVAPDEVDVPRVIDFIKEEYQRAGVDPKQVETGAVIVTGETARARNAEAILAGLADLAGDFVVTVAGPNLEAQIAARGSGAAEWSSKHFATVVNVDIGGGSSNAALFRAGKHVASAASMVGGRQAVVDSRSGQLTHLAPSAVAIVKDLGLDLCVGSRPNLSELKKLTDAMADITVDLMTGQRSPLGDKVALTEPLAQHGDVSAYFISGGIGALYYDGSPAHTLEQVVRWGDIGPLFAESLRHNERFKKLRIERPANTLRATVLGAASQQVTLSGSTIWTESSQLPLKNLPVIEPDLPPLAGATDGSIGQALAKAVERWDRDTTGEGNFAISLTLPHDMNYQQLQTVANGVGSYAARTLTVGQPLILVTEQDFAQILGQTIKGAQPQLPLIVVDQIGLGEGDFIDIGEPMFDGRVVPVSVKTLVFYQ
ncbi:ethanolamine ammonia-lyase reactivating factor EutA [Tessaracoccus antarcticus]|uniref:Ethanolamine utilization protein EutA n=1 Tax=Tessaracoccus antarcticus TaxID=2479848 RepID=A0A3M0G3S3_9ACTN|nr:ethanolamine ammonia-lyase reactivating factor EutA [Tessaracoccus antarcticus]RMB59610.1 ethanolamine utilization protein EutA [Tessaracoccus antarcticus]